MKITPRLETANKPLDYLALTPYYDYTILKSMITSNETFEKVDDSNVQDDSNNGNYYDFYYTNDEKQPNKWVKRTVINILTNPISIAIKAAGSAIALFFN